jgi:transcriptional regulator NrdR family protein
MIKNVIKRDGRVEEFSAEKINSWIQWSSLKGQDRN